MTRKIAVSLPDDLFEDTECYRRTVSKTRSAAIREALELWLKTKRERELDEQYERGYREHPEDPKEVEAWARAGLASWDEEDWSSVHQTLPRLIAG